VTDTKTRTLHLSYWDQVVLRRLLFSKQNRCEKEIEKNRERGWEPEPGRIDISSATLKVVNSLLERLPDPGVIEAVTHTGGRA
jgi:hypothetical protein